MKFERFISAFEVTETVANRRMATELEERVDPDFRDCIKLFGGKTFGGGIYRILPGHRVIEATMRMQRVFPEIGERLVVFGYDWLGRHFSTDQTRVEKGQPLVLMLEPGAGEAMQIPASISDFHNRELVDEPEAALALGFYREWKRGNPRDIPPDKCVGYKIPLFLDGRDDCDNLELIDLSVYVELCGQLRNKVRSLPNGASIRDISLGS